MSTTDKALAAKRLANGRLLINLLAAKHIGEQEILNFLATPDLSINFRVTDSALNRDALRLATGRNFKHVARRLLDMGFDVNQISHADATALHLACKNNNRELITLFIERGASLCVQDITSRTPLHYYAQDKAGTDMDPPSILVSLTCDFNPNLCDKDGLRPIDLICRDISPPFAWMLAKRGANLLHNDFILDHSDLGERLLEAICRWNTFEAAPDVSKLTADDLYHFANVGHIADAFHPRLWRGHETQLQPLLSQLPPYLITDIFTHHPHLSTLLPGTPQPLISDWTIDCSPTPPSSLRGA